MRIAVCDNDKIEREHIFNLIRNRVEDREIISFETGKSLVEHIKKNKNAIDLIYMDVMVQDGNGIEFAREIRKINQKVMIIFITAVEEYVFQAFDVKAFHYIVKPFSDKLFLDIFEKAEKEVSAGSKSMMIHVNGSYRRINLEDIVYAEVFNRNIVLHMKDEEVEYYGKLQDLERIAGSAFFRTHRSYLVNLSFVSGYEARKVDVNGEEVLLAKNKHPDFVKAFLQYHKNKAFTQRKKGGSRQNGR